MGPLWKNFPEVDVLQSPASIQQVSGCPQIPCNNPVIQWTSVWTSVSSFNAYSTNLHLDLKLHLVHYDYD